MKNKTKILTYLNLVPTSLFCVGLASCSTNSQINTTCKITFTSGEHGKISEELILTVPKGTLWKDIQKPETTPNDSYKFDGWYVGSLKCSDTFVINQDILPIANFELIYKNEVPTNFGGKKAFNYGRITDSVNDTHIETFYIKYAEKYNNPNFAEAMMLNQCIRYKKKHPDKNVWAVLTSFHFSHMAGACIDKTKPDYGLMREMNDAEEDDNGYIRIAYSLIKAAKAGIETYTIGHIPATFEPSLSESNNFVQYFEGHMDDLCDDGIHKVKDFLKFKRCKWPGYGDKAATDLMHLKNCTISAYTDDNNIDHDAATYVTSSNLDCIKESGVGGWDGYQTGVVVSDHDDIARCFYNYTKLLYENCEKEDIMRFRHIIRTRNKNQIDSILAGNEISKDEQVVYLGTKKDNIFELYLTPFAGSAYTYDTKYNPYSKYLSRLVQQKECSKINLVWLNPKFDDSEFARTVIQAINASFLNNPSLSNKLILGFDSLSENDFKDLQVGTNIQIKSIGELGKKYPIHAKDLSICYENKDAKEYVTLWNTLNFHMGANYYQSNSLLVIKENSYTHNSAYIDLSKFLSFGSINEEELV